MDVVGPEVLPDAHVIALWLPNSVCEVGLMLHSKGPTRRGFSKQPDPFHGTIEG